jgi:hypothetical protein
MTNGFVKKTDTLMGKSGYQVQSTDRVVSHPTTIANVYETGRMIWTGEMAGTTTKIVAK